MEAHEKVAPSVVWSDHRNRGRGLQRDFGRNVNEHDLPNPDEGFQPVLEQRAVDYHGLPASRYLDDCPCCLPAAQLQVQELDHRGGHGLVKN